jgi:hypothetical protein
LQKDYKIKVAKAFFVIFISFWGQKERKKSLKGSNIFLIGMGYGYKKNPLFYAVFKMGYLYNKKKLGPNFLGLFWMHFVPKASLHF